MTKEIWISANEAAKIIEKNSGRPIIAQYVRDLAQKGKIAHKPLDGRTNVYLRSDVEKIKVRANKKHNRSENVESSSVSQETLFDTPSVPKGIESQRSAILPIDAMKRADFVKAYGINNGDLSKWLKHGLGDDQLEVTKYTNEKNRESHCFTLDQQAHNLEILRKHGKLKQN